MTCNGFKLFALFTLIAALAACSGGGGGGGGGGGAAPLVGGPRAGLTQAELDAFDRGREIFEKQFKPSEGLGPFYNAVACASCHSTPVTGGSAPRYRNFYLAAIGNTPATQTNFPALPSIVIPAFGSGVHSIAQFNLEGGRATIPSNFFGTTVTSAQRNGIPMFGLGLFETITDATIMSNSDPDDADGDGISGRFNSDLAGIGRFGVKAQSNNIELFTRAPLQNQMGITTMPFLGSNGTVSLTSAPFQVSSDPNDPTNDNDGVPDPEMSTQDLGDLIAFTRFLAPPQRKPFTAAATRGEATFDQIGCTKCHMPSLPGSEGPVEAYTDLLIHDMGPALADGIHMGTPQASAIDGATTESEFRTQPLWGVSMHAPFLHDGRADTLEEAIILHGGEAEMIKQAFLALPQVDRDDILAFLECL